MTQVETDSGIISMYLKHLADLLEVEDPNFRESTIIILDGATYHHSE